VSPKPADALLRRAAEAGIHRLAIPTPFAVGRVNCWLIDDEPLTLVDTGPNSGKSLDELEQGLTALGHRVEDLQLIVITHQHMDHLGLAQILARRSGAEVAALDLLAPWLGAFSASMEADDAFGDAVMARHGVPQDLRLALRSVSRAFHGWGAGVAVTRELADGTTLELRDRRLRILHRPGHSPSDITLHDPEQGILLGGDHLIGHISSNPIVSRPLVGDDGSRPQALVTYLDSLRRTQAMDEVELVLPGHGDPITRHAELIDERFALHARRARKIARLIAERGRTAFDIAHDLWGNVAVTQAYLTISEVLGHVDLLLNDGSAVEIEDPDGVARFAPAD
jgi:glyoxylase-like metal-dependent hydrolase (beta-lactamase superfamily II)